MTDEVADISNICQLVLFVKYYDYNEEKAGTVFVDCWNLLEFSKNSSPNADAIVSYITEKFQELIIEIPNLKVFVSDGASVKAGQKVGVATKLKINFALKMFNIYCICHKLALACADTGDDYNSQWIWKKFWLNFGDSSKTLPRDFMKVTLSAKEFDSLTEKKKKNHVKLLKKACRTR